MVESSHRCCRLAGPRRQAPHALERAKGGHSSPAAHWFNRQRESSPKKMYPTIGSVLFIHVYNLYHDI